MPAKSLIVLGSTGSIGRQALEVIEDPTSQVDAEVIGLASAGSNIDLFIEQALRYPEARLAVFSPEAAEQISTQLNRQVLVGIEGVSELARTGGDTVLNGIAGAVGLAPTLAALEIGSKVALANKESLVAGGELVKAAAKPGQLIPVDSEHSAIFQLLQGEAIANVSKLILTASGGPFRGRAFEELHDVTPEQALAHPTWSMGPVVSINSATLVNKGLEVIEAHLLFDISYDQIEVVIHPQSYIHSLVEFEDGSTTAQLSPPNMKVPIAYSLTAPDRGYRISTPVDWSKSHTWQFLPIETLSYPGLELAFESGRSGGISSAIFNAANESAVAAFLSGKLPFTSITKVIERVLNDSKNAPSQSIDTILDVAKVQEWAHLKSQILISERMA